MNRTVEEKEEDEGIELLLSEPEIEIWLTGGKDDGSDRGRDDPARDHA